MGEKTTGANALFAMLMSKRPGFLGFTGDN
jgi:hypothetical protein